MIEARRRVIKLKLSPRDAADSLELLKNVEAAFQHDDLEIDMRESQTAVSPELEPVEEVISREALKTTGDALDLNDQLINQGIETVPEPAEARGKVRQWLNSMQEKGIEILAGAAAKAAFGRIFEELLDKF